MLDVICVLKTGSFYNNDYVEKLRGGVARYLTLPYNFWCLTDDEEVDEEIVIPLQHSWPGWWSKLEVFRDFRGHTLFIDLDTIIVGSLDELVSHKGPFISIHGFYRSHMFNSGFMSWTEDFSHIYKSFSDNVEVMMEGKNDQQVIGSMLESYVTFQETFPGQVVSYKVHCRGLGKLPPNVRVVCFHGKPRPHEVNDSWMKEFWR